MPDAVLTGSGWVVGEIVSGSPRLLAASAVAASHTGDTTETALATVTIPARAMGLNGGIEVRTTWSMTSSANNKTLRVRFGGTSGTSYASAVLTTSASTSDVRRLRNRGSASSQVSAGVSAMGVPYFSSSASALITSSVDTSAAVDLVFTCQLASAGETITLEMYEVWLLP